ncbi:MAG: hypothetical protein EOO52_13790 [Gammaproteobacteria bacterium]|nr:MAG: hypothetical protein EOO52_13790 [Gammaproteobacteria bacterium]
MKNLTNSHVFTAQSTGGKAPDYLLELGDDNTKSALSQGLYHQVQDWVALELTAEQMLSDELTVVRTYVADDANHMWSAIKDTLLPYELAAGQMLLRAADPTQVEWSQNHWWDHQDSLPN